MGIKLDMIGLVTKDIEQSLKFYRTLGLEIGNPTPGEDYFEVTLANGLRISWNTVDLVKKLDPHWEQPVGQRIGLAFLCDNPAAVDQVFMKLREAGYGTAKEPFDAFWGQRYSIVLDPDGNAVDLFAPLGTDAS